ncbi:hypothetical protein Bca52824_093804 [Brassica carinata]|uniref:Cysteine/Histidine-rich C1 domain family protein n=1 Tax=Brassica carinata TaxID=52824 RepID=A0A8X7P4U3_BRACI|nr:hypothetical protein Bca52824_093804 [Brassica carinata]
MESEGGVLLPLFHEHPMMPRNDLRRGDCCGRYESQSDGYFCKICVFFVHKKCGDELSQFIDHPSHPDHPLELQHESNNRCDFCRWDIVKLFYRCDECDFDLDLHCAKHQPPNVIDNFETHPHKLILLKNRTEFDCSAECGKARGGLPYKCDECDVSFHVDCVWHPEAKLNYSPEVNHPYHSLHPLKLLTGPPPDYSDGKCRLCGTEIAEYFYHCSSCNFTVDLPCVFNPPPKSLVEPKVHDHQLTLLPRLDSFTCNACGLKGDRSPYACFDCGFMIHQDCLGLPRVININRHDHRVSRTSVLGDAAMNSVCGVCRKKVDWTYGGFSCKRCPGYVAHSKCATRKDVWNGKELEGIPEEEEDTKPYVEIDENTIQHFSHKEHHLRRIHGNGIMYEEQKRCKKCAECPKRKRHVLHNERLTLDTNKDLEVFRCDACYRRSNGFMYKDGDKMLDVLCGSISEPFVHPSHPHHPSYYIPTENDDKICNGCNRKEPHVLRCIEGDCGFVLCFKCATQPKVVKHRVDDHPLSLCYGEEEEASGKYWCDICEKETDSKEWFYTLHRECVLGDSTGLMPRTVAKIWGKSFEVVLNNSVTRPFCSDCKDRSMYPIYLKLLGRTSETYLCSLFGVGLSMKSNACIHPIGLHSFYTCMDCDFSLHQKCAECPKRKRHVLHNERLTLDTNKDLEVFRCDACYRRSNGFMYKDGDKMLDVLCGSISEPFVHPSHPHHPSYYIPTENDDKICNGCNRKEPHVLRCIEGDCGFVLCFKCATQPKVVKHRVDDHPLSLCYGEEEEASGKYWCDICEKETDSKEWFYTCKDQRASLHRECVLGDSTGLMPRTVAKIWGKSFEVVLNNSVTRPFCSDCKDRSMYPIYLKLLGRTSETYLCSVSCTFWFE